MTTPFRRLGLVLAATAIVASACSTTGLDFRQDHRVSILQPGNYTDITLPLHLRWRAQRVDGYRFALFVDRSPMAPLKDLRSLASRDPICLRTPGCPDEPWLKRHNVYLTTATALDFSDLTNFGNRHTKDAHEVTIVLVDGRGRRTSESAWGVVFYVRRTSL